MTWCNYNAKQSIIIIIEVLTAGMAVFYVAGYLIEEMHIWPVITVLHEDNVLNKFRILKESIVWNIAD